MIKLVTEEQFREERKTERPMRCAVCGEHRLLCVEFDRCDKQRTELMCEPCVSKLARWFRFEHG